MWGELPDASRKIEVAKEVFRDLDASLFRNRDVAPRIYGHRRAGDCSDSELAVPFGAAEDALSTMADRIDGVTPPGQDTDHPQPAGRAGGLWRPRGRHPAHL